MRGHTLLAGLIACVALSGCSGSGATGAPGTAVAPAATPAESSIDAGPSQAASADLPGFMSDFDRVCETQVGFGGAAAYEAASGLHPVVLFTDFGDPPTLIQSSATMPAGWTVTEDADYSNNAELAAVQLVACSRRLEATPNGTKCDFEPSDGSGTVTLELTDTVYELTIYSAQTGEAVGVPKRLQAATTECPYIASFKDGDTKFLNDPSEDQYVNALKAIVAQ